MHRVRSPFSGRGTLPTGLAAVAAVTALTLAAPPGRAAMAVRLRVIPDPPRAGRTTLLTLRTFTPYPRAGGGFRLEPAVVAHYPFRVRATSGATPPLQIPVAQSDDPHVWLGAMRFPRRGSWTIRVENFGPRYEAAAGAVLHVRVVGPRGQGHAHDLALVAAAVVAGLLLVAAALRATRRRA